MRPDFAPERAIKCQKVPNRRPDHRPRLGGESKSGTASWCRYCGISGRTEFPKTNGPRPTAESAADRRLVGSNPTCGAKHLHNRFCALLVDWVAARICANWPIVSKTVFSAAVNTTHTAKHQARPARFQSQFLNVSAQRRAFG